MRKVVNHNKVIEKAIKNLSKLDTNSKKKIIIGLTESIKSESTIVRDIKSLYGAWEDTRDSDEIIREIKESRVNYTRDEKAFE